MEHFFTSNFWNLLLSFFHSAQPFLSRTAFHSMPIQQYVGCKPWDPMKGNEYGYLPHLALGIFFVTLFSLSTILHTIQASWKRRWWCMLFALGALSMFIRNHNDRLIPKSRVLTTTIAEAIGWAGRTWSSQCPNNLNAFLMQITTLIIGKICIVTITCRLSKTH